MVISRLLVVAAGVAASLPAAARPVGLPVVDCNIVLAHVLDGVVCSSIVSSVHVIVGCYNIGGIAFVLGLVLVCAAITVVDPSA